MNYKNQAPVHRPEGMIISIHGPSKMWLVRGKLLSILSAQVKHQVDSLNNKFHKPNFSGNLQIKTHDFHERDHLTDNDVISYVCNMQKYIFYPFIIKRKTFKDRIELFQRVGSSVLWKACAILFKEFFFIRNQCKVLHKGVKLIKSQPSRSWSLWWEKCTALYQQTISNKVFKSSTELPELKLHTKVSWVVSFKLTVYITQKRTMSHVKVTSAPMLVSGWKTAQLCDSWSAVPKGNMPPTPPTPPCHLHYQHETLNKHLKKSTELPAKTGGMGAITAAMETL